MIFPERVEREEATLSEESGGEVLSRIEWYPAGTAKECGSVDEPVCGRGYKFRDVSIYETFTLVNSKCRERPR